MIKAEFIHWLSLGDVFLAGALMVIAIHDAIDGAGWKFTAALSLGCLLVGLA